MNHKTQGSELYVLNTTVSPVEVLKLGQITDIGQIGGQAGKIDVTTLDDLRFKRNLSGLIDPSAGNLGVLYDQDDDAQEFLHANAGGDNFPFAIGLSNGVGIPPTVNGSDDGFTLPSTRGWISFEASVSQDSVALAMDSIVKLSHALQLSGEYTRTPKA